jgi:hypothetical protein
MTYQQPQYPQYPQQPYPQQQYPPQQYGQQPYPQQQWQQPREPRISSGVLVGVSLWRLLIVACAFIGFGSAVSLLHKPMVALSQQASLVVGVVYAGLLLYPLFTGGRRHEPKSPWWRGAMVVLLVLVCVTYLAIIGGSLSRTWSLFEHLITPLVVLIDFFVVGRNQPAAKWWHPVTWLIIPLAYLVYYLSAGLRIYGSFLNPSKAAFPGVIVGFIAALLALGFLLYGFGKLKASAARQNLSPQPYYPPQQPGPPPGYYPKG